MILTIVIGALGNILFGFKSVFQVIKSYHKKKVDVSKLMLIFDFLGNVACTYYIYNTVGFQIWWQFVNYGFATLFLVILFIMMFIYRNNK